MGRCKTLPHFFAIDNKLKKSFAGYVRDTSGCTEFSVSQHIKTNHICHFSVGPSQCMP